METASDLLEDLERAKETAERLIKRYPNDHHFKVSLGGIEDAIRQVIIDDDEEEHESEVHG